nr:hypothetical protein [Tomitella gaofuii]
MPERWLRADCADHVGVTASTWSAYVNRHRAPQPIEYVGRTPLWDADEVRAWHAGRPGQGARTDRR